LMKDFEFSKEDLEWIALDGPLTSAGPKLSTSVVASMMAAGAGVIALNK
jgi:hypothetical protein